MLQAPLTNLIQNRLYILYNIYKCYNFFDCNRKNCTGHNEVVQGK
jgi:hypothetical protein